MPPLAPIQAKKAGESTSCKDLLQSSVVAMLQEVILVSAIRRCGALILAKAACPSSGSKGRLRSFAIPVLREVGVVEVVISFHGHPFWLR
jgi:hypothetical protein